MEWEEKLTLVAWRGRGLTLIPGEGGLTLVVTWRGRFDWRRGNGSEIDRGGEREDPPWTGVAHLDQILVIVIYENMKN